MPPPISSEWSDSSRPNTNTNTRRLLQPIYPWDRDLAHTGVQALSDEHGPDPFDMSSQESDSDDLSSSLSDSLSSERHRRITASSALAAFRRRYEALHLENSELEIARALAAMSGSEDGHLSDSDSSIINTQYEVRNYATNSESEDIESSDESVAQHDNATQSDDNSDGLGSGSEPEMPTLPRTIFQTRDLILSAVSGNSAIENIVALRRLQSFMQLDEPLPITEGVPLRRQNAIRGVSSSLLGPLHEYKIELLRKDMRRLLRDIKAADSSFGTCPLFEDRHIWNDEMFPVLHSCCPQHEDLSLNSDMTALLLHRKRSRHIWKHRLAPQGDPASPFLKQLKRKCSFDTNPNKKRKKLGESLGVQEKSQTHLVHNSGDTISGEHLSDSNKDDILKGISSSFLKGGSSFTINFGAEQSIFSDVMGLTFSEVCHETSRVSGFFRPAGFGPRLNIRCFQQFMLSFADNTKMDDGGSFRDIVSELFDELNCLEKSPDYGKVDTQIMIPFLGDLIDFQKNDLRYVSGQEDGTALNPHAINDQILFQMGEWLKLKPFSHLSETFFLKQLRFGIRSLKIFSSIPKRYKKEIYNFCKDIVDQSWFLTKHFELLSEIKIPIIEKSFVEFQRENSDEGKRPRLGVTPFIRRWNSEIYRKLGDFACCADSCLLNLQLNYVLFKVEVDVYAAMELALKTLSKFLPQKIEKKIRRKFLKYGKEGKYSSKSRKTTLICSLDRKTGRVELLKTRSEAEFKIPFSRRRYFSVRESTNSGPNEDSTPTVLNVSNVLQRPQDRLIYSSVISESRLMTGFPKKGSPVSSYSNSKDEFNCFI